MIFDAVTVAFSLLLLVYWLRYSCLLILRNQAERDQVKQYATQVVIANHLHVFKVQSKLAAAVGGNKQSLDGLDKLLDRDYRLLLYLIRHAVSFQAGGLQIEKLILVCNYRITRMVYKMTRAISTTHAAKQLGEMAAIITGFANIMGERAALGAS